MKKSLKLSLLMLLSVSLLLGVLPVTAMGAVDDMDAVSLARRQIGKDYRTGGESPSSGFNASGLVYYVFRTLDYSVPRDLGDQYRMNRTKITSRSNLKYGDVLFFGSGGNPDYAGIYIGNGRFVFASKSKDEVVVRSFTDYYKNRFMFARRVLNYNDRRRADVIAKARTYLGTPYKFGADFGQTRTFDCSSFTKTVFSRAIGLYLPRESRDQAKRGVFVKKRNLKAGDLVFYSLSRNSSRVQHVGIYAGNNRVIHTYGDGGVKYTYMGKDYWSDRYVTARRVIR